MAWADFDGDDYLIIVTKSSDTAYPDAYTAIKNVNDALNLPSSLYNDMINTTSADGKQKEHFDNVIVTWENHPDSGLEVIYYAYSE